MTPTIYVLFSDTNSWWSGPIKWVTDGLWGHVAVIFQDENGVRRPFEAVVESGVTESPMSKFRDQAADPKKRIVIVELSPSEFGYGPAQWARALKYAENSVGKRSYATWQLGSMLFFEAFHIPFKKSANKVVCSEFVSRALEVAGIYDCRGIRNPTHDTVNPGSLWARIAEKVGGVNQYTSRNAERGMLPLHPLLADVSTSP